MLQQRNVVNWHVLALYTSRNARSANNPNKNFRLQVPHFTSNITGLDFMLSSLRSLHLMHCHTCPATNWSPPNALTHGLMPPVPIAVTIRPISGPTLQQGTNLTSISRATSGEHSKATCRNRCYNLDNNKLYSAWYSDAENDHPL